LEDDSRADKEKEEGMTPTETVLEFVRAINARHIDKIVGMMTPDHTFVDPGGNAIPGRRAMRDAWLGYFEMVPDYLIEVEESLAAGQTVVVLGAASGTYSKDGCLDPRNHWDAPAAWRAEVEDERISRWQVFADLEPLRRIMRTSGDG
jgi:ketosteroid isomerase-like protein